MEHYTKRSNTSLYRNLIYEDDNTNTIMHDNVLYSPSRSSPSPSNNNNNNNNTYYYSSLSVPPPCLDSASSPSPSLLHHCVASLHRHEGIIFSIATTKGLVFTGSESSRIRAWRQPDCTERGYFKSSHGEVRAILAHGNTLFTAHKDRKVRVWNINPNSPVTFRSKKTSTFPKNRSIYKLSNSSGSKHKDCISCMAYNHAEGLLYTGSWDRTVRVWSVSNSQCVDSILAHEDQINAIIVNQDDGCVFTCSSDGTVKIWRRVYGQSSHTLTMTLKLFQPSPVNALTLSSSSKNSCFVYSGSSDGLINYWEKEKVSGRYNHGGLLEGHRFSVSCLVSIEKLVFSGSEDTTIRVWRRRRREEGICIHECLGVLDGHKGPVKCLAASMEMEKVNNNVVMGFLVYSCGLDRTFKAWRIRVLPEEKDTTTNDVVEGDDHRQYEMMMSPVLSPSWVERKLQGDHNNSPFR